ncbi:TPA: conjugal transfer protein TraG [Citrobacter farmeri]|uniref:Conjugal transfer protein TraG n=1 Tax=Citrobacter farmeri TaxID=67824 RepID=A0A8H9NZM3_9ENTR|nr:MULTISPECIES: conjugal transfer protein TraG N-terminal domain-containing protein [Enterobacteriaceae]EHK0947606.1 conjugal transfer protein TraG N-terminal domain-containing protein [Citrobacter farmeri]EKT9197060.1 conjugal transfer protein TraG N-terminal domain-containing protein [Citrobacter freundii]EKX4542950.1 conjugal transfer protein TraG N-terminal domain-containing protein [Citrobacter farmeri]EKX4543946.1 conjugal transfer protein TraG N-terminal domain-containing protein [Citro
MKSKTFILLALLCASPSAFALDGEYVIMGGFSTIVNAFLRLKLMFNDNEYKTMLAAFVTMGMISALLLKSVKGGYELLETGKGQMGLGWLYLTVIGTLFYFGLVANKGTIHIYDQSRNQYQAVSGIPDFLIATASTTNAVYQGFVDMANRNTATTTRFTGEGTPIKMLLGVLNRSGAQFDSYLTDNIRTMWNQCSPVAETRGFDARTLKSGSSVLDVVTALAPLRNQAVFTQWYSPSNPSGITITCDQAYLTLKSDLGNPAAYNARLRDICTKNGYSVTDAAQFADCKGRMEEGFQTIFSANGLSLNTVMSNVVVSQAIADAMLQNNPEVAASLMANRAMINGGMADATTNPEWLSFIMSGVIAIILSITPLLLLLVFTPIIGKALILLFGLWIFITTWQIADTLLLQAGTDEILTAMNDIRSMGLGIDAVQMGPSSTMKAMAVMASARETAVQIAMLVASLFGVSAYGIGAFGQKAMGRLDRVTEEVSDKAFTPEGKGAQINAMRQGHAALQTAGEIGSIEQMSNASAYRDMSDSMSSNLQIQALGGAPGVAAQRNASVDAGRSTGTVKGYEDGNIGGGYLPAESTAMTSTQANVGDSRGRADAAENSGMNVTDMSALTTGVNTTMQTADAKSNLQHGGGTLSTLGEQQREVHGTERSAQIGHAGGVRDAANASGKSVTEFTRETTATGQINEHATGQGQLQAAGSLSGMHSRGVYTASAESDERLGRTQALHNAYDENGGITSGVAESNTEHLKQNLSDMREQKANVNEIGIATGKSEGESRQILSESRSAEQMGTLEGNHYSPEQMQANSAWSSEKGANVIQGEKTAFHDTGKSMPETAQRRGEIDTYTGLAEQGKFNTVSNVMGGDKPAADALAGANTNMAVTQNEAQKLADNGLLDPVQVKAIPDNSVGTVHMGLRLGEDGKAMATSSVATGQSTSIDNSFRNDSGQTMGTETSALQQLESTRSVNQLLTASEHKLSGSSPLTFATEASRALNPIYNQAQQALSTNSTSASAGISTPAIGKLFGLSASAVAQVEQSNVNSGSIDLNTALFQHKVDGYRQEAGKSADEMGLTGAKREQYITDTVAPQAATLFKTVKEGYTELSASHADRSTGNDMRTPVTPQDDHQVTTQPRENMFSVNGAGSPQEYMAMQRQQHHQTAPRDKPAGLEGTQNSRVNNDDDSASSAHPPITQESSQQGIPVEADTGAKQGNIPR